MSYYSCLSAFFEYLEIEMIELKYYRADGIWHIVCSQEVFSNSKYFAREKECISEIFGRLLFIF